MGVIAYSKKHKKPLILNMGALGVIFLSNFGDFIPPIRQLLELQLGPDST